MVDIPKNETLEESWYKDGVLTNIVTSKNNRNSFILYKVFKNKLEKIAKSNTPSLFMGYWKGGERK